MKSTMSLLLFFSGWIDCSILSTIIENLSQLKMEKSKTTEITPLMRI